ncbi:MAG: hypothetical protein V7L20_32680 [Nostoc sp.]|uniref:hypothetical protein n=1 Tax=Nostoc sp. TaxID=1180 RepID=UPI002FF7BF39
MPKRVYGFTTATFYRGRVFAEPLEQRLRRVLGVLVVVPALALLEALVYLKPNLCLQLSSKC